MSSEIRMAAATGVPSIINSDTEIVGDMKGDGGIQIDGTVKGNISCHTVTIGEQGKIDGTVVAESVWIFGTINGQVKAKTVQLNKTARVTADIAHETITIEAGAHFEGKVHPLKGASSTGVTELQSRPAN